MPRRRRRRTGRTSPVTGDRGMETTTCVRNIYKYYAAYKLTVEARTAAGKAREKLEKK